MKSKIKFRVFWLFIFIVILAALSLLIKVVRISPEDPSILIEIVSLLLGSVFALVFFILERRSLESPFFVPLSYDFSSPTHARYRQTLIDRVRSDWVKDVYEKSLYNFAHIELGLASKPEALDRQRVFRFEDKIGENISSGTSMYQLYQQANKHLLILGAPGSGKTTMLLELTRDLLNEAEKDAGLPTPVVFNLSSWAQKQEPLEKWLVEQLKIEYGVNRKLGETWVQADLLLLLLDGLDEVQVDCRNECLETINQYKENHGLNGLVVCSRSEEYKKLQTKLDMRSALEIKSLTYDQIIKYLKAGGSALNGLLTELEEDQELRQLARTPLMLNVMGLAYKDLTAGEVSQDIDENPVYQIFSRYVERMFERKLERSDTKKYNKEETIHYLAYLARQLHQNSQTIFNLKDLQSTWLENEKERRTDKALRAMIAIIAGLLVGLSVGELVRMLIGQNIGLFGGLLSGVFSGWLIWDSLKIGNNGFNIGLLSSFDRILLDGVFLISERVISEKGIRSFFYFIISMFFIFVYFGLFSLSIFILSVGLFGGLVFVLVGGQGVSQTTGLIFGLGFGVILGLEFGGAFFVHDIFFRFLLQRSGHIPPKYVDFLDYASEHILLRKKGEDYIFIHQMLLEYFANLKGV